MPNYGFVIDNSFSPFTMQEMLVPFTAYKDSFEKTEEAYNDLSDKSDKFKYLSETLPEGSKARDIYEGYANDLRKQAEDLAHNGLSMSNRRALTSMKRRYQGEIGRLMKADEAMAEEKKLRQTLGAQDSSRLYATDNLSIDDFLDGNNPNLYSISGNELYTRGAAAGKAASSRVFSAYDGGSTLNGYYRDYIQKMGYSRDTIQKFYKDMSAIPELQMAADAILEERGVNQNLTGDNLRRARQSVINGMIDGAVYQENHSPQRDLGKIDASTQAQLDLTKRGQNISLASQGLIYNDKTGEVTYDKTKDPNYQKAIDVANAKEDAKGGKGDQKYAGYDKLTYTSGGGSNMKYVEEIPARASKVNVETTSDGKYAIYVGTGANKLLLGSIDGKGKFTKNSKLTTDNFAQHFGHGMSWYQISHTYDPEYDDKNIEALANDILEIAKREGSAGYKNYDYYLEPDNVSWSNGGGGFYRSPLSRIGGTVNSSVPGGTFTGGYGE